jgi:hypothetical protein
LRIAIPPHRRFELDDNVVKNQRKKKQHGVHGLWIVVAGQSVRQGRIPRQSCTNIDVLDQCWIDELAKTVDTVRLKAYGLTNVRHLIGTSIAS